MRGYLLDTHALIWWLEDAADLSEAAHTAIEDPDNDVFASTASLWEIGIKFSTGKMTIHPKVIAKAISDSGLLLMGLEAEHTFAVADLPFLQKTEIRSTACWSVRHGQRAWC